MAKQYIVTYDSYDNWKLPLNLAVGFHLLIALSIVFLPGLFKAKPKFEDIYTVNLINLSEPAVEQQPVQQQPAPAAPEPEPVVSKKAVAIAEPVKPTVAPAPPKAVSIKPLQRKIKKKVEPTPEPDRNRAKELEKEKREKLAEALRAEQLAAEQARLAAEEAERQQKLLEQQLAQIRNQARTPARSTPSSAARSSSTRSLLDTQYQAAVINRVSQFWTLPEIKRWDPSLQAVISFTVTQDGAVINPFIEQSSGDQTFDQFVKKALQDAAPLPAIPPALRKQRYELGLRFRPGSIQ